MDHRYLVDDVFHLICLQMSDHMPFYRLHLIELVHDFLHLVFSDVRYSGINRHIDLLRCPCLADCHQKDIVRTASALLRCFSDLTADHIQVFFDVFHLNSPLSALYFLLCFSCFFLYSLLFSNPLPMHCLDDEALHHTHLLS